uniref:DUF4408 domain-containing protein n=1 Tax=Globodera pallida TaxID=36090 RepID=A0A183CSM7_GLOPA
FYVIINFIVESLEINQKYRHHSNEVGLKHPKVPFSSVAENAYKLALAQSRGQQPPQGRHKGRIRQRQQYSPTTKALINAPSLPPPIASVVFDRGGGGQWQFPNHDHHHNPLEGNKGNGDAERVEEHSVVHLISRPTQLYYYGGGGGGGGGGGRAGMENAMRSGHGDGGVGAEQQFASASIQV